MITFKKISPFAMIFIFISEIVLLINDNIMISFKKV